MQLLLTWFEWATYEYHILIKFRYDCIKIVAFFKIKAYFYKSLD